MYKYLVMLHVGLPLVGVAMMEAGVHGPSIGMDGYANGASLVYMVYVVALVFAAALVVVNYQRPEAVWHVVDVDGYRGFVVQLLVVELIVLLVMLFGFDALLVWQGKVGKGEFRVSLGTFGAVAFFFTKTMLPAMLACATAMYAAVPKRAFNRALWWGALLGAFLVGTCWGYKTTPLLVILPALLVRFWRLSLSRFAALGAAALPVVVFFYMYFDDAVGARNIGSRLWQRLTVMQGDVSWGIWNQYKQGIEFPSYLRTLYVVVGDRLFSLFSGIDRADYAVWVQYHYDLLLTSISGIPLDMIQGGHSLTGTPFAEGVIAAGAMGPAIFGTLAGLIVGVVYVALDRALRMGSQEVAAVLSTYFCFYVLAWLSGGAILQLAHISVVLGLLLTFALLKVMRTDRLVDRSARSAKRLHSGSA